MTSQTQLQETLRAAWSPDHQVRLRAALRLGTLADPTVAAELVALLVAESDPFVRETLTWVVVRQAEATLPHLVNALDREDTSRVQVLHALSKIRDPDTVEHVLPLVDDPHPEVAAKAWWALGRTGTADAAPALLHHLGGADDERRHALTRALEQLGEPAVPGLAVALSHEDPTVRRHAAEALAAVGSPALGALDALVAAAEGTDRELAMLALEALAPLDDPRVDEVLTRMRDGESRWLATVADWLLGQRVQLWPSQGPQPHTPPADH